MMSDGEEPVPEPEVGGTSVDAPVQAASIMRRPAVSREVAARIDLIGSPTLRRVIDPRTAERYVKSRSAAPGGAEWRRRQTSTKYPAGTAA
jgi:hypothetical protein